MPEPTLWSPDWSPELFLINIVESNLRPAEFLSSFALHLHKAQQHDLAVGTKLAAQRGRRKVLSPQ
jgi:hypothetical protein